MIKLRKGGNVFKVLGLALTAAAAGCATADDPADLSARAESGARYIVQFRDGHGGQGKGAVHAAGGAIKRELGPQNAVAAHIPAQALNGLSNNPHIEYIEEDVEREPLALWSDIPNGSGSEISPFGIQMVQGNLVTSPNAGGRKVCIIDSGYSTQHVDLRDSDVTGMGEDVGGSGNWFNDSCGHGSHVAGTIAAIAGNGTGVVGVLPGVKLHIVKVFGTDDLGSGSCVWAYSSDLIAAVNECRTAGANVINMSLGGGRKSRTEENAFKSAAGANILSIASAGNGGTTQISFPAGYASVLSVAAIDSNETVAGFSQKNRDVELAAPGVAVLSTVPWLEDNSLTAGSSTWMGLQVEGAARTTAGLVSGTIVDGGQCTAGSASWSGNIVLCQRGTISFAEKVNFVSGSGGKAAVIYNNVASDATCGDFGGTMGEGVTSTIPAITLSCDEGAAAQNAVNTTGNVKSAVIIPNSGYEAWDGTSMAAPHVSAVAALVWSCYPDKTAAQIRAALTASARDLGATGKDNSYGYGVVQAKAAVLSLGGGSAGTCIVN